MRVKCLPNNVSQPWSLPTLGPPWTLGDCLSSITGLPLNQRSKQYDNSESLLYMTWMGVTWLAFELSALKRKFKGVFYRIYRFYDGLMSRGRSFIWLNFVHQYLYICLILITQVSIISSIYSDQVVGLNGFIHRLQPNGPKKKMDQKWSVRFRFS